MALIGTIRKNFWFVLLLLGFALAAFILMDMQSASNLGGGGMQMTIGEINGTELDYREWQTTEGILYSGATGDIFERRNNLWNYFIDKTIVDQESEKLGIDVSREELMDLQFGANLSPIIQQNWRNPNTGQVDFVQLQQIKNQIETGAEMDARIRQFWSEQEKQIITSQKQEKINTLSAKAFYTPTWMAEQKHTEENATVDFAYVKIPYDQIDGSNIELTDADYTSYLSNHASDYTNDEITKSLKYAVFNVVPTGADSATWSDQISGLAQDFRTTDDDSLFVVSNGGGYQEFYFPLSDLTPKMQELMPGMENGEVVGPYIDNGRYNALKLVESKIVPDTVRARHILKNVTAGNVTSRETANVLIDSLTAVLRNGLNNFDTLAAKFSDDPGSKDNGGLYEAITQGQMVPSFNEVCFYTGKKGSYYKVQTQYGVHLIEILNQKYNNTDPKYKIGLVGLPIIPTKETQDRIYEEVAELIGANPYWDALTEELNKRSDVTIQTANNLKQNDYIFADLGSGNTSRDIIKWAYESGTSANDVSPNVYTYTDEINYYNSKYVISGLAGEAPAGLMSAAAAKDDIEILVLNQKKGESLMSNSGSSDLSSIASQYSTNVDTLNGITFGALTLPQIGREPEVIGCAFNSPLNTTEAVAGNDGVYFLKPLNKSEASAAPNLITLRTLNTTSKRASMGYQLFEGLRDKADVVDKRFTFF